MTRGPNLLGDQEDTRLYPFILVCMVLRAYDLRRGFGECHAEVERRMEGGQKVGDDIHLVDPFHLGKVKGERAKAKKEMPTRRSRSPSFLHFCSARCR
jgi:hypothetical protein